MWAAVAAVTSPSRSARVGPWSTTWRALESPHVRGDQGDQLMSNLSVRARIVLIVVVFSVVALALTLLSISSLNGLRDAMNEISERDTTAQLSLTISRDLEA